MTITSEPLPRGVATDFPAFEAIDGDPRAGLILICDHASNALPAEYDSLGLPAREFERHIAYDPGAAAVTRGLASRLGAPAVLSCFSRLLIDPNRGADDPTLIMRLSDGAVVPGKDEVHQDRHAKVVLVAPGAATSSSNALACGAVLILREAIEKSGYDWHKDGATLPDAMLKIMQDTGVDVADTSWVTGDLLSDLGVALTIARRLGRRRRSGCAPAVVAGHGPGYTAHEPAAAPTSAVASGSISERWRDHALPDHARRQLPTARLADHAGMPRPE